jgi:hypothetical protein
MNANYSDSLTLRQAREQFFAASKLPSDGGYSARWVRIEAKPLPFYFPNTASRIRSVKLHDLHHIATGYATDWPGEIEIGAWENSRGCADHLAAWFLNSGAMAVGIFLAPRRMWLAFRRGRHTANLYRTEFDQLRLDEMTVGSLRAQLRLDSPLPPASAADIMLFLLWCVGLLLVYGVVIAIATAWLLRFSR